MLQPAPMRIGVGCWQTRGVRRCTPALPQVDNPMPVTSIVAVMNIVQATVPITSRRCRASDSCSPASRKRVESLINEECVRCFPARARVVMGPSEEGDVTCSATGGEPVVAPVTPRGARATCR